MQIQAPLEFTKLNRMQNLLNSDIFVQRFPNREYQLIYGIANSHDCISYAKLNFLGKPQGEVLQACCTPEMVDNVLKIT